MARGANEIPEGRVRPAPAEAPSGLPADDAFHREALALAEESAGVGVWSIDLTTQRVRGTAQFFRIMGLEPTSDSVPVDVIRALRHPADRDRVIAGFRDALDGGGDTYEIEYRIIRPDGNLRWIFGRGRVIRDRHGTPVRYSGVDLDITGRKATEAALEAAKQELEQMNQVLERRVRDRTAELEAEAARRVEAESRLNQSQKMEAVGQLTGGIAHDFNNILQVIMGSLEIIHITLQRGAADGASRESRALAERVTAAAQRAALSAKSLVQRLLAFGRQQPLAPTTLDVNALVVDMTEIIDRALGATIVVETALAEGGALVFADRSQLESVLLNLVVNARDAMPRGGWLRIATANIEYRENVPDDLAPGAYVLIDVVDTGVGIAPEHLDRVFEPFFTTKDTGRGSGLGLSMVYGFVKQSGGHVRIDSELGRGTTVRIYLPGSTSSEAGTRETTLTTRRDADGPPAARPGETILLVDDDESVRRVGVTVLEDLGYRVVEAADARAALRILTDPERPSIDLVVTDVVLPGGMSGADLGEVLSRTKPRLPVLFTSGYTRHLTTRAGQPVPEARLLHKPYSIEALASRCRQAIDDAGSTTGAVS